MTSSHPLPIPGAVTPTRLGRARSEAREFAVMLLSVFLLASGAVTAGIACESGQHGWAEIAAGPVAGFATGAALWLVARGRRAED